MQKKSLKLPVVVKGILIIITAYFFLANLPIIDWLEIGLDASWAFAISDATYKQFCLSRGNFNSESHRLRKSKAIILPIA